MKEIIWLDDLRDPRDYQTLHSLVGAEVLWIKGYKEFTEYISLNGLPDEIWFDHDLGEKRSGYDCAKWLVGYCLENNLDLPAWHIQSQNPVGRRNIESILLGYEKYRSRE